MKKIIAFTIFCLLLASCAPSSIINSQALLDATPTKTVTPLPLQPPTAEILTSSTSTNTPQPTVKVPPTSTPVPVNTKAPSAKATTSSKATTQADYAGKVPNFDHIVLIVLENRGYDEVIGNPQMPDFNALAKKYVLLTNDFAVRHPSLPNYIALVSGDTQKIASDCTDCFVNATNLADLIEVSGRTWKSYEENLPSPCYIGDANPYAQKHDPFIYFDSIRTNPTRCDNSIVPLTMLDTDLAANQLPNFSFIMPNLCNSGHDCTPDTADKWAGQMVAKLQASPALGKNSLIIITFDEGNEKNTASCCGMGTKAGGQVATILISPLAKPGFTDATPISHYGLLKTILVAWNLPNLGKTSLVDTQPIVQPW